MRLLSTIRDVAGRGASRCAALNLPQVSPLRGRAALILSEVAVGIVAFAAWIAPLQAETIYIPNGSFESPLAPTNAPYAMPDMDYWQKSSQPAWYEPTNNYNTPWEDLMGTFYNAPIPSSFIDNCDGVQAAFLFAVPGAAIFQDYNSIYGTNTTPSHAFNATFNVNSAYSLTVGVIGGGGGMYDGATLELGLYYRDASSNMVTVAATMITNSAELFPTNTHFVDFSVYVPDVGGTNLWAGQNIGIQIASTVGFDLAGGYWDVDNVRLTETALPALTNPHMTNSQFGFTLQSQPGLVFEIIATTNLSLPLSNWTSLGTLTNLTGAAPFLDPATNLNRRFYQAHQLP
jgi:hypothetical protein